MDVNFLLEVRALFNKNHLSNEEVILLGEKAERYACINGMLLPEAQQKVLDELAGKVQEEVKAEEVVVDVTETVSDSETTVIEKEVALNEKEDLQDFQCPFCDRTLGSKSALTSHVKRDHNKKQLKEYNKMKEAQ